MHCRPRPTVCKLPTTTQMMPAQVAPTQHNIVEKTCEYIVPEVFPSHTTNVTNHVYKHVKSFPQTQSFEENISHQQFVDPTAGRPPVAGAMAGPGMGAPVAGAMYGPQAGAPMYGPQAGGPVAGAMAPPRPNMMGPMGGYGMPNAPVMGAMSPMHHGKHHKSCGCKR